MPSSVVIIMSKYFNSSVELLKYKMYKIWLYSVNNLLVCLNMLVYSHKLKFDACTLRSLKDLKVKVKNFIS